MTNILVLGVTGMLGSMVFDYLSKNENLNIYGTVRNEDYSTEKILFFDANNLDILQQSKFKKLNIDYIINCIGITKPFSKDNDPDGVFRAININAKFPWQLARLTKDQNIKTIQICTDCVYSGKKGAYNEKDPHDPLDVYGKSKSLGEVFDGSSLLIRCSIIGPEKKEENNYLLEWFLNQPNKGEIGGYAHHYWNGITTLQFAQLCESIIEENAYNTLLDLSYLHHYTPTKKLDKFELMNVFNEVFEKNLKINRVFIEDEKIDRSLSTLYNRLNKFSKHDNIRDALNELKKYISRSDVYNI
ncbi:MAG: sugar nucleotide-binding protein [Candidatus Lokiarchaeota archaeon]|nr:sugar nucleotide-binding protein [Candidatus Lokiarchaeota archaeon]